jgi:hypothetical protein
MKRFSQDSGGGEREVGERLVGANSRFVPNFKVNLGRLIFKIGLVKFGALNAPNFTKNFLKSQ